MKLSHYLLALSLGFGALTHAADPVTREFYVSPAGDDLAPGTKTMPVRTLARARNLVRMVDKSRTGDIVVYLRDGVYPLSAPLEFGPEDSGANGATICYRAYGKETPVISGGVLVTGWTLDHDRIYKAVLNRDVKLRALYVNGVRAPMAQTAKPVKGLGPWGEFKIQGTEPWAETPGATLDGIRFPASVLTDLSNPESVELVQKNVWNQVILGVRDIVREGDEIIVKLQQPYGAIAATLAWDSGIHPTNAFTIRNARELLTSPGQFYFDRASHAVYYFAKDGEDMSKAEVIAPMSEGLLHIAGTSISNRVHNLRFQGLTFAHDGWLLKELAGSRAFVGVQSMGLYVRFRADGNHHRDHYDCLDLPQATVELRNCDSIVFERNRFENLGSACAISLVNDVRNSTVEGNVFTDLAGNAVSVGHPQHYQIGSPLLRAGMAGACVHNAVKNNLIRDVCREFYQEEAITAFFTQELEISHNDVGRVPYGGIAVGWWWGNAEIPPSTVPRDNVIAFNKVFDTQRELPNDGGAIYVLGKQPGGRIEGNYVHSLTRLIYPDDGSAGWTIARNVLDPQPRGIWLYVWTPRIHDLRIENNFTTTTESFNKATNCTPQATVLVDKNLSGAAKEIVEAAGLEPAFSDLKRTVQ